MTTDGLSYRPFPIDALPEPIRGYVISGAQAISCDRSFLALPLLVALAAAIGNTRRLTLKSTWSVPAILWGAIVGESGTAKTPAFAQALGPVYDRQGKALARHAREREKYDVDLARWEKDMQAWKKRRTGEPPKRPDPPEAERFVVNDTTVEAMIPILRANPRGLLLARDELSGWFGSFDRYAGRGRASTDSANWLSMFNGKEVIVDRRTGTPQTIHVPRAAVSICGGIQPAILQRVLASEHRESGLAARFLLAFPPCQAKQWTEQGVDPKAELALV